ncbi:hypothetical protein BTVI_01405 [Pitangus sulphuratus]|nr:hypothetical protein BTVI_01405 [Pitangus sulphuratus]
MVSTTDIADPQSTSISGLMDPGADVTIIAKKDWPGTWSLTPTLINISGVGGSQFPLQSNAVIRITGPEDRSATYPFHICHTRSHTTLPGPVAEGNQRADQLAVMATNPVEFELLGSVITNFCIRFQTRPGIHRVTTDVTPRKDIYKNTTLWCSGTKQINAINTSITDKPLKLAQGDFLICGERA